MCKAVRLQDTNDGTTKHMADAAAPGEPGVQVWSLPREGGSTAHSTMGVADASTQDDAGMTPAAVEADPIEAFTRSTKDPIDFTSTEDDRIAPRRTPKREQTLFPD